MERAKAEALGIMGVFVSTMKKSPNPAVMMDLATQGGPAGIIAFMKLMEAQQYANANYVFPKDIAGFFEKVLQLKKIIQNWDLFLKHLAAAAAQAASKAGTSKGEAALEMIARLTLLQDLFSKMHQKGWRNLIYSYGLFEFSSDFFGSKEFSVTGFREKYWHVHGWIEPYLGRNDVKGILERIEQAAIRLEHELEKLSIAGVPEQHRYAIVQVIDNYDSRALADLCSSVSTRRYYYGVPVIAIAGGQVACHSQDISEQGAQDICNEMGLCFSSSSSSKDRNSLPDGTYSVPMGDPYTRLCPSGYSFCII